MSSPQPTRERSQRIKEKARRPTRVVEEAPPPKQGRVKQRGQKSAGHCSASSAAASAAAKGKAPAEDVQMQDTHTNWFDEDSHWREYFMYSANKKLVSPRCVEIPWLRSVSPFVAEVLERQGLQRLIEMDGIYYPDLTRVFYTTVVRNSATQDMEAKVNGVSFVMTDNEWKDILGLDNDGFVPNKAGLIQTGVQFNKIEVYRSMMKNPAERIGDRLMAKPLKLEFRLLHYILTWVLMPRGSNHSQVFEDDLVVLFCLQQKYKINWVHMIKDTIWKSRRLCENQLPYACFIAHMLHKFKVPVKNEASDMIREDGVIKDRHIKQMGYEKIGDVWREKGERGTAAHPPVLDEDEDAEGGAEEQAQEKPLSAFEQMVLNKLERLNQNQDDMREEMKGYFNTLSDRLDALGAPHADDI